MMSILTESKRVDSGWLNTERIGIALAILAALGFSFKAIFVKLAYLANPADPVDAVALLGLRMIFSLPFFLWAGFSASRNATPLTRKDWLALTTLGLLGYYASSILDFIGLQYISAGLERLILFTYPTLAILLSVLFFGHKLQRIEIAALLLSYIGIGFACAHDLKVASDTHAVFLGASAVFAASLTYAIYLSGSAPLIARLGAMRFTALAMLVSTMGTGIHFLISEPFTALAQPWSIYAYSLAMAIFSTVLPVFMLSTAIGRIGSARAVLIGTLGPVLTIFFSWWLLHEPLSWAQMGGTTLVVGGVMLVSLRKKTQA